MKISIHDYEHNRSIIAEVPEYLSNTDNSSDDIAQAVITALGLSLNDCEYMVGEFDVLVDFSTTGNQGSMHKIEELSQDFKEDALEALNDSKN